MNINEIYDIAGRFDISDEEARRIAETVDNEAEFIEVWENTDWWTGSSGVTYYLWQDGDLWLVPTDHEWEEF